MWLIYDDYKRAVGSSYDSNKYSCVTRMDVQNQFLEVLKEIYREIWHPYQKNIIESF